MLADLSWYKHKDESGYVVLGGGVLGSGRANTYSDRRQGISD